MLIIINPIKQYKDKSESATTITDAKQIYIIINKINFNNSSYN